MSRLIIFKEISKLFETSIRYAAILSNWDEMFICILNNFFINEFQVCDANVF